MSGASQVCICVQEWRGACVGSVHAECRVPPTKMMGWGGRDQWWHERCAQQTEQEEAMKRQHEDERLVG